MKWRGHKGGKEDRQNRKSKEETRIIKRRKVKEAKTVKKRKREIVWR